VAGRRSIRILWKTRRGRGAGGDGLGDHLVDDVGETAGAGQGDPLAVGARAAGQHRPDQAGELLPLLVLLQVGPQVGEEPLDQQERRDQLPGGDVDQLPGRLGVGGRGSRT
jgi:hypothetical protein